MCAQVIEFKKPQMASEGDNMQKILKRIENRSADELLKEYNISLEPPIDLDLLMKKLEINVRAHDFSSAEKSTGFEEDSILGATLLMDDDLTILYKKYKEKRNNHGQRFTVAHELGHCVLHAKELEKNHLELRSDLYNKNDEREMNVNRFAGQLLIPKQSLLDIINRLIIPSLNALAEIFDVSVGVMRERLKEASIKYYDDAVE